MYANGIKWYFLFREVEAFYDQIPFTAFLLIRNKIMCTEYPFPFLLGHVSSKEAIYPISSSKVFSV